MGQNYILIKCCLVVIESIYIPRPIGLIRWIVVLPMVYWSCCGPKAQVQPRGDQPPSLPMVRGSVHDLWVDGGGWHP